MARYKTIKELVISEYVAHGGMPPYEKLTDLVLENFPSSKWKESHYSWYKSKIGTGQIPIDDISDEGSEIDVDEEITGSIDTQVSLESDLQQYLASRVEEIESGLKVIEGGIEYKTEAGRIDILTQDTAGDFVIIELKAGKAKDAALGQLLGYIGCLSQDKNSKVRGILIASNFDQRVVFAAKALSHIKLVKYALSFKLEVVKT